MRILGIDPGLARVGYGVVDFSGGEQRMLDCGVITTDSSLDDGSKIRTSISLGIDWFTAVGPLNFSC